MFSKLSFQQYQDKVKADVGRSLESFTCELLDGVQLSPLYYQRSSSSFIGRAQKKWLFVQNFSAEALQSKAVFEAIEGHVDYVRLMHPSKEEARLFTTMFPPHKIILRTSDDLELAELPDGVIQEYDPLIGAFERYLPKLDTTQVYIEASRLAEQGANTVEQLAISLSYLALFPKLDFVKIEFAVGAEYLQEIAKLRAWRILFRAFCEATKIAPRMRLHAVTQRFNLTSYDMPSNLIRQTIAAMAAVNADVDLLAIQPYDFQSDSVKSQKIARHLNALLKHEANLQTVSDPLHGSYAVETMTAQYVKRAWSLFCEIEKENGLLQSHESLIENIADSKGKRLEAFLHLKKTKVGVNDYHAPETLSVSELQPDLEVSEIEQLRAAIEPLQRNVALVLMDKSKKCSVQQSTVRRILQSIGLIKMQSLSLAEARAKQSEFDFLIVSGTLEQYREILEKQIFDASNLVCTFSTLEEARPFFDRSMLDCLYPEVCWQSLAQRWGLLQ